MNGTSEDVGTTVSEDTDNNEVKDEKKKKGVVKSYSEKSDETMTSPGKTLKIRVPFDVIHHGVLNNYRSSDKFQEGSG
jgi:hypothetical protein